MYLSGKKIEKLILESLVNIQSVGNKTINIRNLINAAKFDIFMLTETWLWGDVSDSSTIKEMTPKTYTFCHFPRVEKNRRWGRYFCLKIIF